MTVTMMPSLKNSFWLNKGRNNPNIQSQGIWFKTTLDPYNESQCNHKKRRYRTVFTDLKGYHNTYISEKSRLTSNI